MPDQHRGIVVGWHNPNKEGSKWRGRMEPPAQASRGGQFGVTRMSRHARERSHPYRATEGSRPGQAQSTGSFPDGAGGRAGLFNASCGG